MDDLRSGQGPRPLSSLSRRSTLRALAGGGAMAFTASGLGRPLAAAQESTPGAASGTPAAGDEVTVEWLAWSFFRLTSPTGKVILINPWIEGNPDGVIGLADVTRADLILPSNGHPDDLGSTVQLALQTGAQVFVPFEMGTWLIEQGVPEDQVIRSGPGGRYQLDDIVVRLVNAVHGTALPEPSATTPYGGISAGSITTFENGWTVYFDGNSAATQDMALWGRLYQPDAVIFNMGQRREPLDAALTIALVATDNPNLQVAIPHHRRTDPPAGATSVTDVESALATLGVAVPILDPAPLELLRFGA